MHDFLIIVQAVSTISLSVWLLSRPDSKPPVVVLCFLAIMFALLGVVLVVVD